MSKRNIHLILTKIKTCTDNGIALLAIHNFLYYESESDKSNTEYNNPSCENDIITNLISNVDDDNNNSVDKVLELGYEVLSL